MFAVQRYDNSGGGANVFSASFSSGILSNIQGGDTILTGLNLVNPFSFDLNVNSDSSANNFVSNYVEGNDSATGPFNYLPDSFNIDNALSLVFVRATGSGLGTGTSESYRINSVSVTVEDNPNNPTSVPESSNVLGLLFLSGIAITTGVKLNKKETAKVEN